MTDDIKHIDIDEFRALGFLQEVNRLVLHPAGLAMEITEPGWTKKEFAEHLRANGYQYGPDAIDNAWAAVVLLGLDKTHISGVWDYREDPEGMVYGADQMTEEKRASVRALWEEHREARNDMFGGDDGSDWPGRVQHINEVPLSP